MSKLNEDNLLMIFNGGAVKVNINNQEFIVYILMN